MSSTVRYHRHPPAAVLALLLALPVLAACDSTGPVPGAGGFTATWKGQPWLGTAEATFNSTEQDTLWIIGASPPGAQMVLSFMTARVVYTGPGTYTVGPGDAEFTYLVGGDVRSAAYGVGAGTAGQLVIEERTEDEIRGSVDLPMVHVYGLAPGGLQARFQGSFRARINRPGPQSSVRF